MRAAPTTATLFLTSPFSRRDIIPVVANRAKFAHAFNVARLMRNYPGVRFRTAEIKDAPGRRNRAHLHIAYQRHTVLNTGKTAADQQNREQDQREASLS